MNDFSDKLLKLKELTGLFSSNFQQYKSSDYDESNTRTDFIDKFFALLDWDMANSQGFSEKYREVVREDKIRINENLKSPDYSFRIGNDVKFYLEAKKPAVNIKLDIKAAFQIRCYAYTKKLPLSIITDFEEFAIYDTRIKPDKNDNPSVARIFYCTFEEYNEKFNFIYNTFSKNAILKGSFDKFAEENKNKKGTSEVDKELLKLIENWRTSLAKNIALRNSEIDIFNLNLAVQKIIDRLIFLRIAEDRGIEEYEQIGKTVNKENIYQELNRIFVIANKKYNSGLFAQEEWLTNLKIDNSIFKSIIEDIYYPNCPYIFKELPIEILGSIYEQFLGKTIKFRNVANGQHTAIIEDKPEVKKAGGVYYTPKYIVSYIVENSIGKKIKGKKPEEISKITICDPACGSGSFLVNAYEYLLTYHLNYYTEEKNLKNALQGSKIYNFAESTYRLTIEEKQKILVNHIYGVDIDPQAVEVTKLSLYLKLLENESVESKGDLFRHSDLKLLPTLDGNIKCGNSLISDDFYIQKDLAEFGLEDQRKVNVFNWSDEFPKIFENNGFDCIIGNPPYLRIQGLQENFDNNIDYFISKYQSAVKRFDIYLLFIEKGYSLLSANGILGYICPHKFLNSDFGSGIRSFLIEKKALHKIINFGHNLIFEQASTYTGLFFLSNRENMNFLYAEFSQDYKSEIPTKLSNLSEADFQKYIISDFDDRAWILTSANAKDFFDRINNYDKLRDVFKQVFQGVVTGYDDIYYLRKIQNSDSSEIVKVFSIIENDEIEIERGFLKPMLKGDSVKRYQNPDFEYYNIYPYHLVNGKTIIYEEEELKELFPLAYRYLRKYINILKDLRIKFKTNPKYWYSCHRGRDMNIFEHERIITPYASLGCNMTISSGGVYHNTKVYSMIPNIDRKENIHYWLSIFNSKIMWYFIKNTSSVLRGGYYTFTSDYLNSFPIKTIDFDNSNEKEQHDKLVALVTLIIETQKASDNTNIQSDKKLYNHKIELINKQIDALVYKLYNLTPEEIEIVEKG